MAEDPYLKCKGLIVPASASEERIPLLMCRSELPHPSPSEATTADGESTLIHIANQRLLQQSADVFTQLERRKRGYILVRFKEAGESVCCGLITAICGAVNISGEKGSVLLQGVIRKESNVKSARNERSVPFRLSSIVPGV